MQFVNIGRNRDAFGRFAPQYVADFTEEIERGVAWLDTVAPGWFDHVNLARLQLQSQSECVLGQLAMQDFNQRVSDFFQARSTRAVRSNVDRARYKFEDVVIAMGLQRSNEYGFDLPPTRYSGKYQDYVIGPVRATHAWEQLTLQWGEVIEKKRANAGTLA